jgi:hypothetical protein
MKTQTNLSRAARAKEKEEKEENEPVGILPATWGPTVWVMIHTFAEIADRHDGMAEAKVFFAALRSNLPCRKCRDAYTRHTGAMKWGTSVVEYARALHAAVNVDLGKRPYFGRDTSMALRKPTTEMLVRVLVRAVRRSVEFFDACIREREFFGDAETHPALVDRLAISDAVHAIKKKAGDVVR